MLIREEQPADIEKIFQVNIDAFGGDTEAKLVDMLRASAQPFISLVAVRDNQIVGQIVFTPVDLSNGTSDGSSEIKIMGLGPMAVVANHQRQGIGSELIKEGLARVAALGYDAVVVLGHAHYYPRFGFVPATQYQIKSEYDVPDDVFMIMELTNGALQGKHGTIKYHQAFSMVE